MTSKVLQSNTLMKERNSKSQKSISAHSWQRKKWFNQRDDETSDGLSLVDRATLVSKPEVQNKVNRLRSINQEISDLRNDLFSKFKA